MSGVGGAGAPAGGYGLLGILIADSGGTRARLNTVTQQAADGLVSDSYAGLGAGAAVSLSLRPALQQAQAWQGDIDAASGRMQVAQTALADISGIATSFMAQTIGLNGLNPGTVDSVASNARAALAQVANLLDSRDGDIYVFAGQDSANPPVPNPDQIAGGGFATQIATAVAGLAANGALVTIAATQAVAASNAPGTSPFSAALSQPAATLAGLRPSIATGPGQASTVGLLASANGDVASSGGSTSGSYIRDILRGLATLAGLSSSQANTAGFADVVADTRASLQSAAGTLNADAGVMGDRQSALATQKTAWADTAASLATQLASAEQVDMAKTLSSVSALQTQLQASYQLIAAMQSLTLTKYLG